MVEEEKVSEKEEELVQLSQQKLSEQEIKELINKAQNQGQHEAMFILVLSKWNRPGSSFTDWGRFEVLYGEIEMFELDSYYDYPTTNETTYSIIPKTKVVVILFKDANDYNGKLEKHETLYVFTYHKGWQSIHLY